VKTLDELTLEFGGTPGCYSPKHTLLKWLKFQYQETGKMPEEILLDVSSFWDVCSELGPLVGSVYPYTRVGFNLAGPRGYVHVKCAP